MLGLTRNDFVYLPACGTMPKLLGRQNDSYSHSGSSQVKLDPDWISKCSKIIWEKKQLHPLKTFGSYKNAISPIKSIFKNIAKVTIT